MKSAIPTKLAILCTSIVAMLTFESHAANVVWQASGAISGTTDVSTPGTYFGSWAPFNGGANALPVNGVTFQGFSDLPHLAENFPSGGGGPYYGLSNTADSNYNSLLSYGVYADGGMASFGWDGLTAGHTYLLQIWVQDTRNLGQTRWENFSGGADTSPNVYFPADGTGNGQFIIGTFVADPSGLETITITPHSSAGGVSAQVNLVQVRDLGVIPEPATAGLLGLGFAALAARRRRSTH